MTNHHSYPIRAVDTSEHLDFERLIIIIIIIFIYTRRCQLQRRVVLYCTDIWLVYLRTNTPQHIPQ